MKLTKFISLILLILFPIITNAANLYVAKTGANDANDCSDSESPCLTIAKAMSEIGDGDTIYIAAGTYQEELSHDWETLTLQGAGAGSTIIEGFSGESPVFLHFCNGDSTLTLNNLTIQNGTGFQGGGIDLACSGEIASSVDLVLDNVEIKNNESTSSGGGIFILDIFDQSTIIIRNSVIHGNTSVEGGGIYLEGISSAIIENTTIYDNSATGIADEGALGGGILVDTSTVNINNATIASNSSATDEGGGIYSDINSTITISNSIIDDNTGNNCVRDLNSAGYNISSDDTCGLELASDSESTDPLLGVFGDYGGELSTLPLLNFSPAINNGNNASCEDTDARSIDRPQQVTCDIGAYEANCGDNIVQGDEECDDADEDNTDACIDTCENASCGDGYTQAGVEQCDDGGTNSNDGCSENCIIEFCGDGILQAGIGEECDDGGNANNDGCNATCILEFCGDGILQAGIGEECDDGNDDSTDDCTNLCLEATCGDGFVEDGIEECDDGNVSNTDSCLNSCTASACGDGFIEEGVEECDDADEDNTDACSNTCTTSVCGDGFLWDGVEECDDGNADNTDACPNTCVEATCGDGFTQSGVEACDDGNEDNTDGCLSICEIASCGDGFVQAGFEACDDADDDNTDGCLNTCEIASCGDGFVQAGFEICDDGDNDNTDSCLNTCVVASCGDGFVQTGIEECDDGNEDNTDNCSNTCEIIEEQDNNEEDTNNDQEENQDEADDETEDEDQTEETSLCGNSEIDEGETCDDGNTNESDGCSEECLYEENNDLELENQGIDFDDLQTGQTISLNLPEPDQNISVLESISDEDCECIWGISPESFGSISDTTTCSTELTINGSTQANLYASFDCNDNVSGTYNQTLIISETQSSTEEESTSLESASTGGGGGCSLNQNSIPNLKILMFFIPILFLIRRRVKLNNI
jgi:cysteine-rich repeat protein